LNYLYTIMWNKVVINYANVIVKSEVFTTYRLQLCSPHMAERRKCTASWFIW